MKAAEWLSSAEYGIAKTVRPAQVRMAGLVEKVLEEKGFAMIEAGTGTGKSFGYLIPAILSGKRVIVSTAKKALQRQLAQSDLPFLASKLNSELTYASLKGKNNYVCRLRLGDFTQSDQAAKYLRVLRDFSDWAFNDGVGDLDSYAEELDFDYAVRVTECAGRYCDHFESCGYRSLKRAAKTANILVVNHALLAFDLAMGGGKVLGAYDAIVVDEAHQASKYFREAYTCRIQSRQAETLRRLLKDTDLSVPETLEWKLNQFMQALPERGRVTPQGLVVDRALEVYRDLGVMKQQMIAEGVWSQENEDEDLQAEMRDPRTFSRMRSAATLTQRMLKACEVCVDKLELKLDDNGEEVLRAEDYVTFVEVQRVRNEVHKEFVATPIEIGPLLAPALKGVGTAIFTSATLSTGGNFDYVCREFGLKSEAVTVKEALPHVFNYRTNSCLFVSDQVTAYSRDAKYLYWDEGADVMHELLTASKGGAFILCASYEDMDQFYARLQAKGSTDYRLRHQAGNVDAFVAWFKEDPQSVALGVKSIWEGIDVPGIGLRLVIIPRLPFPNPEDPVFTARKAKYVAARVRRGSDAKKAELEAWQHYDLQETIMDFKQGAGRLIRRETDRGVVAVLDSRVYRNNKRYSATIRTAIPHPSTEDYAATLKVLRALASKI
jgi:ATP-dependent DNA helicase DinG